MIPPAFLHELLARTDIVEVVGRQVQLKKAGINHKGLCPFHAEKSPSFVVSPSRQTYHCFGCGAHGNAFGFLMEASGIGFIDAVRDLAQQAGLVVPEDERSPAEREQAASEKERRATLSETLARAAAHYRRQLRDSDRAKDYLKRRGLTGTVAQRFGIGYAPDSWRGLASAFPSYDDPLLEESGLVISKDDNEEAAGRAPGRSQAGPHPLGGSGDGLVDRGALSTRAPGRSQAGPRPLGGSGDVLVERGAPSAKRYDRFRDRIMFPIRSVQGEVIGFGGRVLDRGEPKYLNSPETPVFVKGRELYGLHEARAALRQTGMVLVVEGYMDVVALAQNGIENAVATLGTACTADHVQKLFRFTDTVVFSFDGDAAGRRAASRALEAALPHAGDTRSVRFLFLPTEHDPDSYVREHGREAFERCIANAVPLSRQLVETAGEGCDTSTAEGRARLLANARPLWGALPDGLLKRQMLGELAAAGQVETADLAGWWGSGPNTAPGVGGSNAATRRARPPVPPRAAAPARTDRSAANLLDRALWLFLHHGELWLQLDGDAHDLLCAQPGPYDTLFGGLERSLHEHGPLGFAALHDELARADDAGAAATLARVAGFLAPDPATDSAAELAILLDRLRLRGVEDALKLLFESGSLSDEAQSEGRRLMGEQAGLKTRLAQAQQGAAAG